MKTKFKAKHKAQAGFTLVELLISVAMSAIAMIAIFATYSSQQKSQVVQNQVVEMQQNIRAAMLIMTRDIREAGCDPTLSSGAGFVTATTGQIRITRDIAGNATKPAQEDGDVSDGEEDIIFGFDPTVDTEPDGIPNGVAVADFCRNDVNGTNIYNAIAQNIERVEFNYIDEDGNTIAAPITSQSDRNRIRAVQVSLLVRSAEQDPKFLNTATYTTAAGTVWGPFNDNFRRRLAATTIQCRNMGL